MSDNLRLRIVIVLNDIVILNLDNRPEYGLRQNTDERLQQSGRIVSTQRITAVESEHCMAADSGSYHANGHRQCK
jgi:hypothetical protein